MSRTVGRPKRSSANSRPDRAPSASRRRPSPRPCGRLQVREDPFDDRVGLRVHGGRVERIVAVVDAQEARRLLEGLRRRAAAPSRSCSRLRNGPCASRCVDDVLARATSTGPRSAPAAAPTPCSRRRRPRSRSPRPPRRAARASFVWLTSCWYWPTPIDFGSIFTSSASGSCSRRAIDTAPRRLTSRSGNSRDAELRRRVHRRAGLGHDDLGQPQLRMALDQVGRELVGLARRRAVADRDELHAVLLRELRRARAASRPSRCAARAGRPWPCRAACRCGRPPRPSRRCAARDRGPSSTRVPGGRRQQQVVQVACANTRIASASATLAQRCEELGLELPGAASPSRSSARSAAARRRPGGRGRRCRSDAAIRSSQVFIGLTSASPAAMSSGSLSADAQHLLVAAAEQRQRAVRRDLRAAARSRRSSRGTWRPPPPCPRRRSRRHDAVLPQVRRAARRPVRRPRRTARSGSRARRRARPWRRRRRGWRRPRSRTAASGSARPRSRGRASGRAAAPRASGSRPASRAICALVRRFGLYGRYRSSSRCLVSAAADLRLAARASACPATRCSRGSRRGAPRARAGSPGAPRACAAGVVEAAGRFLAVARDERHGRAFVEQRDRGVDLRRPDAESRRRCGCRSRAASKGRVSSSCVCRGVVAEGAATMRDRPVARQDLPRLATPSTRNPAPLHRISTFAHQRLGVALL